MTMEIQSKLKLYLLVCWPILMLLFHSSQATDFSYCTKLLYPVKVTGVEITPDPVQRGKPATFNISASTEEDISGGQLVIDVLYYGVRVHEEKRELCDAVKCTVHAGSFVISHTQRLPKFTPRGPYTLRMSLVDKSGVELTCIRFGFRIAVSSSISDI